MRREQLLPINNDKEWSNVFVLGSRVVVIELFVDKNLQEEVVPSTYVTQEEVVPSIYVIPSSSSYMPCWDSQEASPSNVGVGPSQRVVNVPNIRVGRHEEELGVRIDEPCDEPRTGNAIDARTFPSHPFHDVSP